MKRAGLFIGIDKYKNGINALNCAVNDATSLMTAFAKAQYDTVEALFNDDAHNENIIEKTEKIVRKLNAGDLFIFYFSGHGREINGTHYLVGPTGRANKAFYEMGSVSLPQLIELTNIPGLNRLFILDCCRSNILADRAGDYCCDKSRDIAINAAIRQHENKTILPPLILSSCSTGERAFEDSETNHGYFTNALLGSIQDPSVRSFLTFQKSLKITGTPEAQNICWTGDPIRWNEIPLFRSWDAVLGESVSGSNEKNSEVLKYQILYLKQGIEKMIQHLEGRISLNSKALLEIARQAESNGDLNAALEFLLQANKEILKEFKKENERRAKEEKSITKYELIATPASAVKTKNDFQFADNGKTLLKAPADITEYTIPATVTKIENSAFENCTKLRKLIMPESVTYIGSNAFKNCCSLEQVELPKHFQDKANVIFSNCGSDFLQKQSEKNNQKNISSPYPGMMIVGWILYGGMLLLGKPADIIFQAIQLWGLFITIILYAKDKTIFNTFKEKLLHKFIFPFLALIPGILSYKIYFTTPDYRRMFLSITLGVFSFLILGFILSRRSKKKK